MRGSVFALGCFALTSLLAIGGCETIYYSVTDANRPGMAASPSLTQPQARGPASGTDAIPVCGQDAGCLSVLTFNTKHRDVPLQTRAIANALKADLLRRPDFVLLQEVVFGRAKKKGHENTAAALAELVGYECRGTAREHGMEGVAILSIHPFDHYEFKHLDSRDGFLSAGFPRVSVMGEFAIPGIGLVRVVNVHLAHQRSSNDVRRAQLIETLQWMADRQRDVPADVIVLGGDFNIEPGWSEIAVLMDASLTGGMEFMDFNTTAFTSGAIADLYRRVDYVFIASPNRSVESVGEGILWRDGIATADGSTTFWPSDHVPLLQVFAVGED
jgi:endonuclease/exonuclease/phosphatase family metal-dependent hydrolase